MKIGPGVSELWWVENRPLPLTRPMAYTTACTTVHVQAVIKYHYRSHLKYVARLHYLVKCQCLKTTIENETTSVTTHFKKLTTGTNVYIVSFIV